MNILKVLLVAAGMVVASVSASSAVTYATLVDWTPGGGTLLPERSIEANATGAPDDKFLSLGLGGYAVFSFDTLFGAPGVVFEVTNGDVTTYPEHVEILVASTYDGSSLAGFQSIGIISNLLASTPVGMPFNFVGTFLYLALRDVTQLVSPNSPSTDGFDVNAVGIAAVPVPGALLLLGSGLAGLGALAMRKKAKAAAA